MSSLLDVCQLLRCMQPGSSLLDHAPFAEVRQGILGRVHPPAAYLSHRTPNIFRFSLSTCLGMETSGGH